MRAQASRTSAAGARLGALLLCAAACGACAPGLIRGSDVERLRGDTDWQIVPAVTLVRQRTPSDCGAAALEMVVHYWLPAATPDLRATLTGVTDSQGVQAGQLRAAAKEQGLSAFLVEGTLPDLIHEIERGRPILVGLAKVSGRRAVGHYEVVVGINKRAKRILVADPGSGWRNIPLADFLTEWEPTRRLSLVIFPQGTEVQAQGTTSSR